MKRTGPTNPIMQKTIAELKQQKAKLWKRVARELEKPTRKRREVNLSKIQRFAKNGEVVLVPGKVLSSGELSKKITIAAWAFSANAIAKIKAAGGKPVTILDLVKTNPKGTGVKLLG
jgi:large subunit ribosomal protein L18e